jgi:hypothetical protein
MKLSIIIAALLTLVAPSHASSNYRGVLDLGNSDPAAIALREFHDGMWLVGAQQQLWHLQNNTTNAEVFHVSGYWASRLEGQDTAYGPSLGINIGEAASAAVNKLEILVPAVQSISTFVIPPFVSKLSNWTSVEFYGGYRPITGADDHHWIYGIGGKVTIPLSALYVWAAGSNGQKGL